MPKEYFGRCPSCAGTLIIKYLGHHYYIAHHPMEQKLMQVGGDYDY